MRRLTTLAMVLALVAGLAGCGSSRTGTHASSISSSENNGVPYGSETAELAEKIAPVVGEKATKEYRYANCPSGTECTYHQPTTYEVPWGWGCKPITNHPGFNWECELMEVNESGKTPAKFLVVKEGEGTDCWKVLQEGLEYREEQEHGEQPKVPPYYAESC